MVKYSFLEPIKIGHMTLKNRIISTPMARWIAGVDGDMTEGFCAHYERIAKGGASLILPGISVIDSTWPYISNNQLWLDDDKYIPGLKHFVDVIHTAGAKVGFQLWCSGLSGTTRSINDFTLNDIKRMQDLYLNAAIRCKKAGADVVEFHLGHLYLPSQFLSPAFNNRTDKYGADTVENAVRFSVECIDMINKNLCDDTFSVIVKMNGDDFIDGGVNIKWASEAAKHLEKAGISMITVNAGGALSTIIGMSDDGRQPEGWKVHLAEGVKNAVNIPVAACGSIRHPEYADAIINEGKCDVIALGRALYAEPEWVKKVEEGKENEIRHCISCMFCFTVVKSGMAGCSVNPLNKRELEMKEPLNNGDNRKIIVLGAGPSGLEAAVNLAERGFNVSVYEKTNTIGGLVKLATVPPGKTKIGWLLDYYEKQIERLNIELITNKELSIKEISELNPYAIISAMGSNEFIPPIEGIDCNNVFSGRDVLRGNVKVPSNKQIIILGGGLTGLEIARFMCKNGNTVNVLEMLPNNPNANLETKLALEDAKNEGVFINFEHKVVNLTNDSVSTINLKNNLEVAFPADMIILSLGIRPNNSFADKLDKIFNRVIRVGDCNNLCKISSAVQSGFDAAIDLE